MDKSQQITLLFREHLTNHYPYETEELTQRIGRVRAKTQKQNMNIHTCSCCVLQALISFPLLIGKFYSRRTSLCPKFLRRLEPSEAQNGPGSNLEYAYYLLSLVAHSMIWMCFYFLPPGSAWLCVSWAFDSCEGCLLPSCSVPPSSLISCGGTIASGLLTSAKRVEKYGCCPPSW